MLSALVSTNENMQQRNTKIGNEQNIFGDPYSESKLHEMLYTKTTGINGTLRQLAVTRISLCKWNQAREQQ